MITIWVPKRLVEVGLYNVAARSPQELAALSEQSYRDRVKYAAEKVRFSGTKIVMLTGPSASGKTTSAHKLAEELIRQGTYAHVVSLDNFFRGAEFYPRLPDGTLDYENPDTMDLPLVRQCLHELSETGRTTLPIYDFANERRSDETEAVDLQGGVCIVEGIHALNPELTGLCLRRMSTASTPACGRNMPSTAAGSSTPRTSACAAAPCGTLPPGAAAPKRPLPCGTGTGRRDPVYQGLQDHGGLSAGYLLYL